MSPSPRSMDLCTALGTKTLLTRTLSPSPKCSPLLTSFLLLSHQLKRGLHHTLTSRMQNEIAKDQLDQVESHHSEINMRCFIMVCQRCRTGAIALLANLPCNSWFYMKDKNNHPHFKRKHSYPPTTTPLRLVVHV